MTQLDTVENTLDDMLRKKAPVQLPAGGRSWLARNVWWLALIGGIAMLWSTVALWQTGHSVDRLAQTINYWNGRPAIPPLGMAYYFSVLTMGAVGVLELLAAGNLKAMRRSGWRYLFYAVLIQVTAALFLLFSTYGGFGDFIGSLIGATVSGYFLFQIRDRFTQKDESPKDGDTKQ